MKWILAYGELGFLKLKENPDIWEYVNTNYSVREIGILEKDKNRGQIYMILEKDDSIDTNDHMGTKRTG